MTPDTLIKNLQSEGLTIKIIDGNLHVSPKDRITAEIRTLIKAYKDDLVNFLESYEERAAIMEFDAGMSQQAAETAAFEDCKRIWLDRLHDVQNLLIKKRGLNGTDAASEASQWLLVEWMNQHHEAQPEINICPHCGQSLTNDRSNPGLPYLNGDSGHVWVHQGCHADWMVASEVRAKSTLQKYGIPFHD